MFLETRVMKRSIHAFQTCFEQNKFSFHSSMKLLKCVHRSVTGIHTCLEDRWITLFQEVLKGSSDQQDLCYKPESWEGKKQIQAHF